MDVVPTAWPPLPIMVRHPPCHFTPPCGDAGTAPRQPLTSAHGALSRATQAAAARAATWVHYGLLAGLAGGDRTFTTVLGVPPPQWYLQNVATNRFGASMMVWFVGNMVTQSLTKTGAFEVFANGHTVGDAPVPPTLAPARADRKARMCARRTHRVLASTVVVPGRRPRRCSPRWSSAA